MVKWYKSLFILVSVVMVQSCSYGMILYQSNPAVTIRFNTENASHTSVLDTLEQQSIENEFKFFIEKASIVMVMRSKGLAKVPIYLQ